MFDSLIDFNDFFNTEKKTVNYFIEMRWNGKVTCPHKDCFKYNKGGNKIYKLKNGKDFKCSDCKKIFSYKMGTVFENSKISMRKWFLAIYLITSHKKGISSPQLAKYLKVRQATAWFILHRLRYISKTFVNQKQFTQTVKIDEAYLGGSEANRHASDKKRAGPKEKTVVIGMIKRETKQVKAVHVKSAKGYDLQEVIYDKVEEGSFIMTDSYSGYESLKILYKHETVNHSVGEYVKNREAHQVHTNTIEGYVYC